MFVTRDEIVNGVLKPFGISIDDITRDSPDAQHVDLTSDKLKGSELIAIIPRSDIDPSGETLLRFHSVYRCQYRIDPRNTYQTAPHRDWLFTTRITVKENELSENTWYLLKKFMRDRHDLKPSIVYRLADIPAATFHRIGTVQPNKETLLRIGVVLQLTVDEMTELLASAGLAFNPSNRRDVLIKKCFQERLLNLYDLTQKLKDEELDEMKFDLDLLEKLVDEHNNSRDA